MRRLATIALSFSAAVFAAVLLPSTAWQLWAAGGLLALAAMVWLLRRPLRLWIPQLPTRLGRIFCAAALGLLYFMGYRQLIYVPAAAHCGQESDFSATVISEPAATQRGGKVTLHLDSVGKAVYYGDASVLALESGQRICGRAQWQDASAVGEEDKHSFTSRGIYVLLYGKGDLEVIGRSDSLRLLPLRITQAVREQAETIWSDARTRGFTLAELLGDRTELTEEDSELLSETGLAHLFAVSGLHCVFLVTLLGLLLPGHRRRLFAAVGIVILLGYMLLVGMTPSVVRACIMQIALLLAPLFRRDSDGLTALSAALLALLLWNPYAAGSVSLHLSFAATAGLLLLSGRIHRTLTGWYRGENRVVRGTASFVAANLSTTLGALVFTVPLIALYFGTVVPISPISSLLAVPVAGWNFMAGFLSVLMSFVWMGAAKLTGWLCYACVHYVLWVCGLLRRLPWHILYTEGRFVRCWLVYGYAMLLGCALTSERRRKYALATALAAVMLVCAVKLDARPYHQGRLCAVAVDVGQGESVLFHSGEETVLLDCGSANSYVDAAQRVRRQLSTMEIHSLSAVVVSHYHADHTNGLCDLLRCIPAERLYLPQMADESGAQAELLTLARERGMQVCFVEEQTEVPIGEAALTIYPPLGKESVNERGLSLLCRTGEFELLATGDMSGSTERQLLERYALPQAEVLVVGHHGSRSSSDEVFLQAVQPKAALISVGDNSYGHPADSTLARLDEAGAAVYRTDRCGNLVITVY